jgi:antitoxin component HigA of HigAB toxin-antitoxin module
MSAKRPLSIGMIRKLHPGLNIPAAALIKEYELVGAA